MVFHVLNCGVASMQLFEKPADFQAFEGVLRESRDEAPMRTCAYCLMPNHWHLLLWLEHDGELAALMQRLTITARRGALLELFEMNDVACNRRAGRTMPQGPENSAWACSS